MTGDAGDALDAELTHQKLDQLLAAVERIDGRLEAIAAAVEKLGADPEDEI